MTLTCELCAISWSNFIHGINPVISVDLHYTSNRFTEGFLIHGQTDYIMNRFQAYKGFWNNGVQELKGWKTESPGAQSLSL